MLEMLSESYNTWTLLRNLRANVRLSPDKLEWLQDKLLQDIVGHAYEKVPFYR